MKPVYLNALGMTSALGDLNTTIEGLRNQSTAGLFWRSGLRPEPARVAAVSTTLPSDEALPLRLQSRNNRLLAAATMQIEAEIAMVIERYGAHRIGAVIGSSTSGILEGGEAIAAKIKGGDFPAHFDYAQQEIGNPAEWMRMHLRITGPAFVVSTACTSGAKALAAAARLIRAGICDAVIAGGVDSICPLTVSGFSALESVAAQQCNPFSANRDGITIGEGAAIFIVSAAPGPVRLAGYGESSDAHHISAPDPSGEGAEIAIRAALERASVGANQIGYINLHGTATPKNDLMESQVVSRLFGEHTPSSSTKPLLGHTLGAAGAIEAGICWQLLCDRGILPPHVWDKVTDPQLAPLALCEGETKLDASRRYLLSNSFAFGGSNAALILGEG